jgi:hypothetical protein
LSRTIPKQARAAAARLEKMLRILLFGSSHNLLSNARIAVPVLLRLDGVPPQFNAKLR